ncbi:unnamed protein product [Brassica oleracea]|uniref:(rape) hypothetical protein n=1 Tax=Brassica napus TaxID=3708 RepID=A0A816L849_BRANA|nr:unnamed protein product [Brassica napus]
MYITLKLPEIHYQINLVSYKTLHSKLPHYLRRRVQVANRTKDYGLPQECLHKTS